MQRGRGWASLQTSNCQTSGFPTEIESVNASLTQRLVGPTLDKINAVSVGVEAIDVPILAQILAQYARAATNHHASHQSDATDKDYDYGELLRTLQNNRDEHSPMVELRYQSPVLRRIGSRCRQRLPVSSSLFVGREITPI